MSAKPSHSPLAGFVEELDLHVRARYPLLYLSTWEEQRLDDVLAKLAETHGKTLVTWSITQGLRRRDPRAGTGGMSDGPKDPTEALTAVGQLTDPSLVVFKDFHPYLNDPTVVRALRELAQQLKSSYTTLILVSPVVNIPTELEKDVCVLDVPLPSTHDLGVLLRDIVRVVREGKRATVELTSETVEPLLKAALGLTLSEAENAFAKAIAQDQRLAPDDVSVILAEKRQVIRKSGLLEFCGSDESLATVGGLENLKTWLGRRANAFGDKARAFGLPAPKGLLLLGVQGCGKSLTAKAIAATWQLPLLRLDMGRIFSGLVGSSEENMRRATRVAEGVAPAVLWVDELEKGLAGLGGSANGDSGVSARVFGCFLTWLQEKTAPVFVVATANKIDALPPELLRKGRFDEIFFIDLPSDSERRQIFAIQLARYKRDPKAFDLAALAKTAASFSGAEIEQAIVAALFTAYSDGVDLQQSHLMDAIGETLPLAVTMKEDIDRLREWARTRTRAASAAGPGERPAPLASRFG
ncbi:MAG TPA: AAA family ATPase [Myxococcota bacterium]|nr:AAA family ATPase [Myxococcota bacterium]